MSFSKSMLPWCVASLGLAALACGGDGPLEPLDPDRPTPAAIASVSGDDQQGKAGEKLGEPFVVRVTDAQGDGVGGVEVTWRVASGAGGLWRVLGRTGGLSTVFMDTDPDGIARVFFGPKVPGASTVTADVAGLQGSPVTFATDAIAMVVHVGFLDVLGDLSGGCVNAQGEPEESTFIAPDGSRDDVTVPVGTTVEWTGVEWLDPGTCEVRIVSTLEPPGGEPFDSGILTLGRERFEFVPGVVGTWEYKDQVSGSTGTLTAR